jgi:hypothetical protein
MFAPMFISAGGEVKCVLACMAWSVLRHPRRGLLQDRLLQCVASCQHVPFLIETIMERRRAQTIIIRGDKS